MFRFLIIGILLTSHAIACLPEVAPLAWGYGLFAWGNVQLYETDTEGRVAVGGHGRFENYSVGKKLSPSKEYTLVVGESLTFHHGSILNGPAIYGKSATLTHYDAIHGCRKGQAVDFAEATRRLKRVSDQLSALPANGTVITEGERLVLEGTDPHLNVFLLVAENLAFAHSIEIKAPADSVILINAVGSKAKLSHFGFSLSGQAYGRTLWHFPEAKTISLNNLGLPGSLFALYADIDFHSGVINGSVVAHTFWGDGQLNQHPFQGCIAP